MVPANASPFDCIGIVFRIPWICIAQAIVEIENCLSSLQRDRHLNENDPQQGILEPMRLDEFRFLQNLIDMASFSVAIARVHHHLVADVDPSSVAML